MFCAPPSASRLRRRCSDNERRGGSFHPALGVAIVLVEIAAFLVVLFTAVYRIDALSERAFRLLRLITNSAEPPKPPARPPA